MIIYECITVKDLKCDSFQQNISELLLEIFTAPTTFEPKRMLPAISLVNKCKFINADNDNITKRLEYTRFQEDELAKNLMEATAAGKVKFTKEDCEHFKKHQLANLSKRLDRNKIGTFFPIQTTLFHSKKSGNSTSTLTGREKPIL